MQLRQRGDERRMDFLTRGKNERRPFVRKSGPEDGFRRPESWATDLVTEDKPEALAGRTSSPPSQTCLCDGKGLAMGSWRGVNCATIEKTGKQKRHQFHSA